MEILSVIPNLHGMFALKSLINSKSMKAGDVVINGQSGDFITGQHIPIVNEKEIDSNLLLSCIMKKNYSLRSWNLYSLIFVNNTSLITVDFKD